MAITATFNPVTGRLIINGDALNSALQISRDIAGKIFINGGAIAISGGVPTVGNTAFIEIFGFAGMDEVGLDETNGPLPPAIMAGGSENDALSGGSRADQLSGEAGADQLQGHGGDDVLTGGAGNDQLFGGEGNDLFLWNAGHGNDTVDGQLGFDTFRASGSAAPETFTVGGASDGRALMSRNGLAEFSFLDDIERIEVHALNGVDEITVTRLQVLAFDLRSVLVDLAGTLGGATADGQADSVSVDGTPNRDFITVVANGGTLTVDGAVRPITIAHAEALDTLRIRGDGGDDIIDASTLAADDVKLEIDVEDGNDIVLYGAGDETAFDSGGNDTFLLGAGNDAFSWVATLTSENDVVGGQAGVDRITLLGHLASSETVIVSAVAGDVRVTWDVAATALHTLDIHDVENFFIRPGRGADAITIADLGNTDVRQMVLDVGDTALPGGDGSLDSVNVAGSDDGDALSIRQSGATIVADGLSAQLSIADAEAADNLMIFGAGGRDSLNAKGIAANAMQISFHGGTGNDTLTGSRGANILIGGADDDAFVFAKGDGADTIVDFTAGGSIDELHIRAFAGVRSAADVLARATQSGADTVISFGGGDQITLQGVTAANLAAADFVVESSIHNDFGVNGQGDVLFRHADGRLVAWLLNGVNGFAVQPLGTPENAWRIAETGDFNRDSVSDILWRHDDGTVVVWHMSAGGTLAATRTLGAPDNGWRIAETGDFNGDGRSDVLWRHNDGTVVTWLINEISGTASQTLGNPGAAWRINATGDINGDGRDDIIWRHNDGTVVAWLMNGTSSFATQTLGGPDNSWRIADTGDFNADGRDDLLWRNTDGTVVAWLKIGVGEFTTLNLGAPDGSWQIADAGDFNGDTRGDILWRHADGSVVAWMLDADGGFRPSSIGAPEAAWRIQNDPTEIV